MEAYLDSIADTTYFDQVYAIGEIVYVLWYAS